MNVVKEQLLHKHFPNIQQSAVLAGFHRGRRHFHGPVIFPDIVSIHHLHLHVIIEPFTAMALFKYPSWFRFMWVSDKDIMEQVKGRRRVDWIFHRWGWRLMLIFSSGRIYEPFQSHYYKYTVTIMSLQLEGFFLLSHGFFFSFVWL